MNGIPRTSNLGEIVVFGPAVLNALTAFRHAWRDVTFIMLEKAKSNNLN